MPGFAYSLGPRRALGMEELGHWCARLLDTLGIPRVHIGATSMGCQVALALARRHPARVGAMVLAAPTTGCRLTSPWRYLVGLLRASREPRASQRLALRFFFD